MIETFEQNIVDLIKTNIPEVVCESFTHFNQQWQKWSNNGMILVQYKGSKFNHADLSSATYKRDMTFHIIILHRDLREHHGIYSLLSKLRSTFTDNNIENAASPIRIISDRGDKFDNEEGVWWWEMVIDIHTYFTKATTEQNANLKQVSYDS